MADDTRLNAGTAGDLIATDELTTLNGAAAAAGLKVQRVKVGFGTDNILRDVDANNPLPTTVVDVTATGTLAAAAQTVVISMAGGLSAATVQITGTWAGTIQFEGTVNGTDWTPINGVYAGTSFPATTITANGLVRLTPAGLASMRVHMTAFTSGSATISMRASDGVGGVFANQILPARVLENGLVSTLNSSTALLGIGGVLTGTAETVTEFADIRVSVFSDQASATDGLQIQQSSNGTNWDMVDVYTVPAATGKTFGAAITGSFYRVIYTNGATAQTAFRLQTLFHKHGGRSSAVRPQDARGNDNDFEEMLAFSMGYNGVSWDRLRSTVANGLAVDVTRLPALVAGTAVVGALVANQSVNVNQVAGVAAAAGSGVVTLGTQRTVLATDVPLPPLSERRAATLHVTATAAANTLASVSLPAVAGQFHYITSIHLTRTATAALAGTATLIHTSSNLPGTPAWSVGNAMTAGGTQLDLNYAPTTPLKSLVANTATTITMPAGGAAVLNRLNVSYFTAA